MSQRTCFSLAQIWCGGGPEEGGGRVGDRDVPVLKQEYPDRSQAIGL